jgi:hypothetical protein
LNPVLPLHRPAQLLPKALFHSESAQARRLKTIDNCARTLAIETKVDSALTSQEGGTTPRHKTESILHRVFLSFYFGLYPLYLLTGWGMKKEFQAWHRYAKIKGIDEAVFRKESKDTKPYGIIIKKFPFQEDAAGSTRFHLKRVKEALAKWKKANEIHGEESPLLPPPLFKVPFHFGRKNFLVVTNSASEAEALLEKAKLHNSARSQMSPQ